MALLERLYIHSVRNIGAGIYLGHIRHLRVSISISKIANGRTMDASKWIARCVTLRLCVMVAWHMLDMLLEDEQ